MKLEAAHHNIWKGFEISAFFEINLQRRVGIGIKTLAVDGEQIQTDVPHSSELSANFLVVEVETEKKSSLTFL